MLIVPASKEPLVATTLTMSNTPPNAIKPVPERDDPLSLRHELKVAIHVLPLKFVIVVTPHNVSAATLPLRIARPFIKLEVLQALDPVTNRQSEVYPVVVKTPPVPI